MPKPKEPESFEVAGTRYKQSEDKHATLQQAIVDYQTQNPAQSFRARIQGESVTLTCHCNERGLGDPGRRALQVNAMEKAMDNYIKGLKRHFREISGKTLDLKEDKKGRGYNIQQVSMNDRWEIVYRRLYMVSDLIQLPED